MLCLRYIFRVKRSILSLFYSKDPVYKSERILVGNSSFELDSIIPPNCSILEHITATSLDKTEHKYKVWNSGDKYSKPNLEDLMKDKARTPWLWIGGYSNEVQIDMTPVLQEYVLPDNRITFHLLEQINPDIKDWYYMETETYKEIVFPSEGVTIKHDNSGLKTIEEEVSEA